VEGGLRITLFRAFQRLLDARRAVKAEAGGAIEMPEGTGEPDYGTCGIAHFTLVHSCLIIAEAGEAPDGHGSPGVSSSGIEDDTCLDNVERDLEEFLVVVSIDVAANTDNVRAVDRRLAHDLSSCSWCCDEVDGNRNRPKPGHFFSSRKHRQSKERPCH